MVYVLSHGCGPYTVVEWYSAIMRIYKIQKNIILTRAHNIQQIVLSTGNLKVGLLTSVFMYHCTAPSFGTVIAQSV
jgi:hypothetical protein